ncbi:MAG TPA: hypothetical protein VK207_05630 [Bacteroidales bacterium]|nr:hypothetical protein [Bacteroidales bacterium]
MNRLIFFFLCVTLLWGRTVIAQEPQKEEKPSPAGKSYGLFENDDLLEITLRFDITTYLRKKPDEEYLKAELILNPGGPDSISRKIRLRTRGEFRRKTCQMAPIELNLKKAKFGYSDLDSIGKLKLVTQCGYGTNDESYLLREYLVYKLFNAVTDTSFRVRLLKVNYIDNSKGRKPMTQWGFFLEPVSMLAKRTNTIEVESQKLTQKHIFPFVIDRLALFNYMAGNYDWSIPGQHNVKVFKPADMSMNQLGIAIPYDFDWSGIVNASYAVPVETTGLSSVRQRMFLGLCRPAEVFDRQLHLLGSKKEEFYSIINNFQYLKQRDKEDIIAFLETFFSQLKGNHNNIISYLRNSCKDF